MCQWSRILIAWYLPHAVADTCFCGRTAIRLRLQCNSWTWCHRMHRWCCCSDRPPIVSSSSNPKMCRTIQTCWHSFRPCRMFRNLPWNRTSELEIQSISTYWKYLYIETFCIAVAFRSVSHIPDRSGRLCRSKSNRAKIDCPMLLMDSHSRTWILWLSSWQLADYEFDEWQDWLANGRSNFSRRPLGQCSVEEKKKELMKFNENNGEYLWCGINAYTVPNLDNRIYMPTNSHHVRAIRAKWLKKKKTSTITPISIESLWQSFNLALAANNISLIFIYMHN